MYANGATLPRLHSERTQRPSNGERVFTDDRGSLWSAALTNEGDTGHAVIFSCVSDARQSVRAIAVDATRAFTEADEDTLREWLHDAPRIGRLT